jgi:hypothetical protein
LLEELFTLPVGLSPELIEAIEQFMAKKQERADRIEKLEEIAALPGVKGLTAKSELVQIHNEDLTEMNRVELTLAAAKRRGKKTCGHEALAARKRAEEEREKAEREDSRAKLLARAAMFERSG